MVWWRGSLLRSLRTQLSAIFLGFLLLVSGSVTATFFAIHAQADDAVVINLAGRQRMLIQKMTWLTLAQPHSPDLAVLRQRFEQTQRALRNGGSTLDADGQSVTLPPAPDSILRAQLDEVSQTWTTFRTYLENLRRQTPTDPARAETEQTLQASSTLLLAQLDAVVNGFEWRAEAKLRRLQVIQAVFLAVALLLLALGYLVTRRRIMSPLVALQLAARRMAEGQLAEPVPAMGDDELGDLSQAFESMRAEIAAAREQLETHVSQRTHELTAAFEFSQEIVADLELDHLLSSVTDRARVLMEAQSAALCLLAPDGEHLDLAAHSGETPAQANQRQSVGQGLATQVVGAGQTVAVEVTCVNCVFLNARRPGQCVAAPLRTGERILGALCVVRPGQAGFDPDETRALTLLANSAAIAITNAHLVEAGRRQAEQSAALAERERLAAELHDHLAQTLSFLNLKTDRLKELNTAGSRLEAGTELDRMQTALEVAYRQVRIALAGLRQPATAANDLAEELAACLTDFRETAHLSAELTVADPAALSLPPVAHRQVLHIVREALANVRRHAQAQRVRVRVERVAGRGEARFTVEDDGCGFDPTGVEGNNHLGLTIMRARAERSGGQLVVDSAPGAGTKVIARFPLKKGLVQ